MPCALEPQLLSPLPCSTRSHHDEKLKLYNERVAPPASPQLEKTRMQQQRPRAAKK